MKFFPRLSAAHAQLVQSALRLAGLVAVTCFSGGLARAGVSGPENVSLAPNSVVSAAGAAKSFTAVYADADGNQDIKQAFIQVRATPGGANALYATYDAVGNKLYLQNDGNTGVVGGFAPGSSNVISNSQGSLDCSATTVVRSGNNLTVNWNLTPSASYTGFKNVYLYVRDLSNASHGFDDMGDWLIKGASNAVPVNVSLNPASLTSAPGTSQSFTAVYADADSNLDIKQAYFVARSSAGSSNALFATYDAVANKLYLQDDANSVSLGGYAPGSNNVITNSQGSLDCANTTVVRSGNNLTVHWNFTPSAAYAGFQNIYLYVRDSSNATDGFDDLGDWLIKGASNNAPANTSLSPSGVQSSPGMSQSFTAVYTDADSYLDFKQAYLVVRPTVGSTDALFASYDAVNNRLYLQSDNNAAALGGFAPGSAHTISNSQGTLDCANTSVVRSGNTLTVKWAFVPSASFVGAKNVYLYVRDLANATAGFDDLGDWFIKGVSNAAPLNNSVSPNNFTSAPGTAENLQAVYSDADGAFDFKSVAIQVGATTGGSHSLYATYDAVNNLLTLQNDANTAALGGFAPGSNHVISNSQGSLNCAATTVIHNGTVLTVNWNLTPNSSYEGMKNVYLCCRDSANASDGFDDLGDWLIKGASNSPPVNVSLTPAVTSSLANQPKTFSATYSDSDGLLDLNTVYIQIRATQGDSDALYASYDVVNNRLYLQDDSSVNTQGGFAPGTDIVLSNSQGTLNCGATTVVRSGNSVTVNWSFTPSSEFTGLQNVYLNAKDNANAKAGFADFGDWTVESSNTAMKVQASGASS